MQGNINVRILLYKILSSTYYLLLQDSFHRSKSKLGEYVVIILTYIRPILLKARQIIQLDEGGIAYRV